MLVIEKGNYISRVWFLYKDGAAFDILAHLTRRLPDGPWIFGYRIRYYRDEQVHDSKDEKSHWTATFDCDGVLSEAQAVERVGVMLAVLKRDSGFELDEMVIESDEPLVAVELLKKKPWSWMEKAT